MIYDAFTIFNELDLLELRLEILGPYVDKFIIAESHETFTGQPKPLYYLENKERFNKWNDKIVHIIYPNIEVKKELFERHWVAYALEEGFVREVGEPEDIAFFSDLDEIWNPELLSQVDDQIHSLVQHNYSYWLNYLSNEEWTAPLMTKVKNMRWNFNKQYRTNKVNLIRNAGWHFSNMGGVEQIIKKLEAYDHSDEVLPILSRYEGYGIKERMENGYDFLGRVNNYQGVPYKFTVSEKEWPEFLKNPSNRQKYSHLIK